jgi:hypothetical protein
MKNVYFILFIFTLLFLKNGGSFNTINIIEPSVRDCLQISEPVEKPIDVEKILSIITDENDREKFAIFNNEFSKRISKYNGTAQKYNDVYVKAVSLSFGEDLKKYTGLKDFSVKYISDVISSKDKYVTEEEKEKLSQKYLTLSWVLGGEYE